jgi:hypothetical protein
MMMLGRNHSSDPNPHPTCPTPIRSWSRSVWSPPIRLIRLPLHHSCTRVTLFSAAVDKYSDFVAPGKTCFFTGGRVKRSFGSNNGVEISFGSDSDIYEALCPLSVVPELSTVIPKDIAAIGEGSTASTIAIIHALGALKRLVTKKGNTSERRELLLVDDSGFKMVCTTWGQLARVTEDHFEGSVIVVKDGIRNTYNGLRSISVGVGSDMLHEPALTRADQLREWYSGLPSDHSFSPLRAL